MILTWVVLVAGMVAVLGLVTAFWWYLRRRLRKVEAAAIVVPGPKPPSSEKIPQTQTHPHAHPAHP